MDFQYVAYTSDKKLIKGNISSISEAAASQMLVAQGFQLLTIKERAAFIPPLEEAFPSLFKVKPKDVIMFSRQLATLLDAGISLVSGVKLLSGQTSNRLFRKVLDEIVNDLRSGSSFHDAVSRHKEIFGDLYCELIAAGERIGGLETILRQAANYLEKDLVTKKKVKKALMYPAIVSSVFAVVMVVLLTFVLPEMVAMLEKMNTDLPATTQFLVNINDFFEVYKMHVLLVIVFAVVAFIMYRKRPSGRYQIDRLMLRLPLVGKVKLISEMARFTRTLVLLVRAGLPLPEIVAMTSESSGNMVIRESLKELRTGLLRGEGLSGPMARDKIFPPLMVQMVMVGEESGKLESTLETVASNYETEADETIAAMVAMIEPMMTVALAAMIGFIAISVITPMYSMGNSIGQ